MPSTAKVHPLDMASAWADIKAPSRARQSELYWEMDSFVDVCVPFVNSTDDVFNVRMEPNRRKPQTSSPKPKKDDTGIDEPSCWRGYLDRKSRHLLGRWKRQWFHLVGPPTISSLDSSGSKRRPALKTLIDGRICEANQIIASLQQREILMCYSDTATCRSPKLFRVLDFQREQRHENKFCFSFSLTVEPFISSNQKNEDAKPSSPCIGAASKQITIGVATIADAISVSSILVSALHPSLAASASSIVREAERSPIPAFEKLCQLKPLR
mmetsp:Transcript_55378/g.146018  ORF Transcript_55378/g.146018 Transcript_55378/m.146018 type:complete len:269 (-) Transcript_55378:74-880(-)